MTKINKRANKILKVGKMAHRAESENKQEKSLLKRFSGNESLFFLVVDDEPMNICLVKEKLKHSNRDSTPKMSSGSLKT